MPRKESKYSKKRKDSNNVILRKGECQRANGTYHYTWTDQAGKRHFIYAKTLEELRDNELEILKDITEGIKAEARYLSVNDCFEKWAETKRGLRNHTFENYIYMYNMFVRKNLGLKRVNTLKKSDVKKFYNYLADERNLKAATIGNIHTVLHQVLDFAVDDEYLRNNPSDKALAELMKSHVFKTEKRRALSKPEQDLFLNYLKYNPTYQHWYPIFAVMLGTGMRVGEITGLRWCDVDIAKGLIDINHTLVYYNHRQEGFKKGVYFGINPPKTEASNRVIPMLDFVKEAFAVEKAMQDALDIKCSAEVDGYTDFIFINRFGDTQHQGTLNKALRRIIRDCNDEQLLKEDNPDVLLPHFSCHNLRHTFATRMCESGINMKVVQNIMGHSDISTTMDIYTDVTKEFKENSFKELNEFYDFALGFQD